jgi:signal transduction histidine kinase
MHKKIRLGNSKILVYYFLAIVLPSIILGALAFRGVVNDQAINERETRQRLTATADNIIAEINQLVNNTEDQFLQRAGLTLLPVSGSDYFGDSILTGFLTEDSLVSGIFFIQPSGSIQLLKSDLLYYPDGSLEVKELDIISEFNSRIRQGWEYEFQEKNYRNALDYYQNLLKNSNNDAMNALLLLPVARIQKKLSDYSGAINTYNLLEQKYGNLSMEGGLPLGAAALIEKASLYLITGDTLNALKSVNILVSKLIGSDWDLEVSQFNNLISDCNEITRKSELKSNESCSNELVQYQLYTEQLRNEENKTTLLLDFHSRASSIIGRVGYKALYSESDYRIYAKLEQNAVLISVLPQTGYGRWGLIINPDYLIAQIERSIIPGKQRRFDFKWQLLNENRELLSGTQNSSLDEIKTTTVFPPYLPSWSLILTKEPAGMLTTFLKASSGIFIYIFLFIAVVLLLGLFFTLQIINRELVLSKMKSDFISTVSHEFKSPITSVRQMTEMLYDERIKSESRKKEYYAVMLEQTERLSHLIDNILDFSRIEEGRKEFRFEPTDMDELITHVRSVFQKSVAEEGFVVSLSIPERLPELVIDKDAIQQVIYNLLDNAYKYSGNSRKICLEAKKTGSSIKISVQDFGIGIQRDDRNKIFDRFYRGGKELTRSIKGSGIGLTIVKKIIESHHGTVSFESTPGKGSTFFVILPVTESTAK